MKVHYPKLYNMAHLLSLNVFTASKGSNNYILFNRCYIGLFTLSVLSDDFLLTEQLATRNMGIYTICDVTHFGRIYYAGESMF